MPTHGHTRTRAHSHVHTAVFACLCVSILVNPCWFCSLMADQLTLVHMELAWNEQGRTSVMEGTHRFHFLPFQAPSHCWWNIVQGALNKMDAAPVSCSVLAQVLVCTVLSWKKNCSAVVTTVVSRRLHGVIFMFLMFTCHQYKRRYTATNLIRFLNDVHGVCTSLSATFCSVSTENVPVKQSCVVKNNIKWPHNSHTAVSVLCQYRNVALKFFFSQDILELHLLLPNTK